MKARRNTGMNIASFIHHILHFGILSHKLNGQSSNAFHIIVSLCAVECENTSLRKRYCDRIYLINFSVQAKAAHLWLCAKVGYHTNGNVLPTQPKTIEIIIDISFVSTIRCEPYNCMKIIQIIGKHSRDRSIVKWESVFKSFTSLVRRLLIW